MTRSAGTSDATGRVFGFQVVDDVGEDRGDGEIAEPLAVRRDEVPRRDVGRRLVQHVVEGVLVGVPELPLRQVAHGELPALGRVVIAGLEALTLLVLVDGEEELDDGGAGLDQVSLERVDEVVPLRPDRLGDEVVDPDDEDLLVVRAVEDADLALARDRFVHSPQEVVGELLRARDLERRHG